ncbi:unnamed protein product [Prorocentrum cordatum]|uniref:Beta-ketoacyl-[acyl-carrier-protein] synthase I n=1 Tax=Prorocentrum cordatum TaxID=2364126 RepID=A0ABN9W6N8_9DINO|nr:unnamed protein product [Polarella glacialis]
MPGGKVGPVATCPVDRKQAVRDSIANSYPVWVSTRLGHAGEAAAIRSLGGQTRAAQDISHLRGPCRDWHADLDLVYGKLEGLVEVVPVQDMHRTFQDDDTFVQWGCMMTVLTELEGSDFMELSMTNAQRGLQAWATKMWAPTPGAVSNMNAKKFKGVDAMGPLEAQRIPTGALDQLRSAFVDIGEHCMWPGQVPLVMGAYRGTVAVSITGGPMGNSDLGPVRSRAHDGFGLQMLPRAIVGDAAISVDAAERQVIQKMSESGCYVREGLVRAGAPAEEMGVAVDLGIDTTAGGADTCHVCREMARLRTTDIGDEWALNVVVTTGGQWTRESAHPAGGAGPASSRDFLPVCGDEPPLVPRGADEVDPANWMAGFGHVPVPNLVMPGAHDAGAQDLDVLSTGPDWKGARGLLPLGCCVVRPWSEAQGSDAAELLEAGCRYFDLRRPGAARSSAGGGRRHRRRRRRRPRRRPRRPRRLGRRRARRPPRGARRATDCATATSRGGPWRTSCRM